MKASFVAFFLCWAEINRWKVPDCHVRACVWLEQTKCHERLLMAFRGFAKSTIYGCYKAWQLYCDPQGVNQVWAADSKLAGKMSRYTRHVLLRHPWCAGLLDPQSPVGEFFVAGATDLRNPSMQANSILGNSTGSRASAIDFDDVEVPKNIRTKELRESLRERIQESTHILVPGGQTTYIGTPHTHQSIYSEVEAGGAATLKIPLFARVKRYEQTDTRTRYSIGFPPAADGYTVMLGIGRGARVLEPGRDYRVDGDTIVFSEPPRAVLDIATGNAWPERFNRADIQSRRRGCRTINSWDSQYQLHARPIRETRLDPDRMLMYEVEPVFSTRNGHPVATLGQVQLEGFTARWDVSLGKVKSDVSALAIVFTDLAGRLYWHRAIALTGDLEEVSPVDGTLIGGQIRQLIEACLEVGVHHVVIESNGPGGFVPAIARRHCAAHGITVAEEFSITKKAERILDAFEPPLSSQFLYAHRQVFESDAFEQMREFDPSVREQPDDYLDAAAGAIAATPVRVNRIPGGQVAEQAPAWQLGEQSEVELVGFDSWSD